MIVSRGVAVFSLVKLRPEFENDAGGEAVPNRDIRDEAPETDEPGGVIVPVWSKLFGVDVNEADHGLD